MLESDDADLDTITAFFGVLGAFVIARGADNPMATTRAAVDALVDTWR